MRYSAKVYDITDDITHGIYQSVTCVTPRRFTILQTEYIRASRALLCEGLRYYRRNISERNMRYSAKVYDITDGIYQNVTCVTLRRFTILQTEYIRASRALLCEGLRYYRRNISQRHVRYSAKVYDITDGIYQSVTCVTQRRFTILQTILHTEYIRASRALLLEGLRYYRRNISERHVRYSAKVYDITDGIYQSVTCVTLRRFTILQTEYIRASRALLSEGLRYYRWNISGRNVRYSAKVYDITDGIYQGVTCVTLRRFTILPMEYIRA